MTAPTDLEISYQANWTPPPESKIAELFGSAPTADAEVRKRTPTQEELDSWEALKATGTPDQIVY